MSDQAKKQFKEKLINQIMRVTTKNGRIFEGKLKAVDFRANLVLHQCIAEIPPQHNCPLNAHIDSIMDSRLKFTANPKLSAEQQQKQKEQYLHNHYYIGGVMIAGNDIRKVQMRNPPLKEESKQNKQENKQDEQKKVQN